MLMAEGYEDDPQKRSGLVHHGIRLPMKLNPEDSPTTHLRVIEQGEIWVIAEPGRLTYLEASDY